MYIEWLVSSDSRFMDYDNLIIIMIIMIIMIIKELYKGYGYQGKYKLIIRQLCFFLDLS